VSTLGKVEITADLLRRFERLAPAALARRSRPHLDGIVLGSAQLLLLGVLGLCGLYFWRWSPLTLFLMMVAGLYASIVVCTLRWLVARRALRTHVDAHNDDRFVWAMVEALRERRDHVEHAELVRYRAGIGIAVDWLLGALALAALGLAIARREWLSPAQLLASDELRWALAAAVGLPLVQGMLAISSWRDPQRGGLENFGAGVHGAMALAFAATLTLGVESAAGLRKLMIGLNVAIVVLGVIALLGCQLLRGQTAWLRAHLQARMQQTGQAGN
jgi:hypothetical protein